MRKEESAVKEHHEDEDTNVVFLNEKIHSSYNENGSMWGVFLMFGGILLLFNTFGIIPWEIWQVLLRFWPVLIIVAGIQMILGGSRFSQVLVKIITLALFGWVILIAIDEVSPKLLSKLPEFFKRPIEWWEVISR